MSGAWIGPKRVADVPDEVVGAMRSGRCDHHLLSDQLAVPRAALIGRARALAFSGGCLGFLAAGASGCFGRGRLGANRKGLEMALAMSVKCNPGRILRLRCPT